MTFVVYLFAVLKSVIYGSSVFFTSKLTESVDVLDVLALRFILSFVALWILKILGVLKIRVGIRDFFCKTELGSGVKSLFLAAIFEPVLYMLFETLGISMTTGITAGVILSLAPVSSCLCEMLILKEKNTFLQKIFLAAGIAGVIYIAVNTNTSDGQDTVVGILFMVLAVVSGSLFSVFSRQSAKKFNAFEVTYVASMLGMIAFNAVNVVRHIINKDISGYFAPYMNADNMVGFIFLSIISTIAATSMNNFALGRLKVSTMSAFGGLSTLVTIFVSIVFNNEKLCGFHVIGLILIVIRMVGVSYIDIKNENKEENDKISS